MVCEIRENLEIKLFGTFVIKVFVYVTFVTKLFEQKHLVSLGEIRVISRFERFI